MVNFSANASLALVARDFSPSASLAARARASRTDDDRRVVENRTPGVAIIILVSIIVVVVATIRTAFARADARTVGRS